MRIGYGAFAALLAAAVLGVSLLNAPADDTAGIFCDPNLSYHYIDTNQYARLGEALLHGRTNLDLPVASELAQLENPYDPSARAAITNKDTPVFWDHAFYQGKYYCYYGVVPAVVLYAPYQLVTGSWLSTPAAVRTLAVAFVFAAAFLVWQIARRSFPKTLQHPSVLALALVLVFASSNVVYLVFVRTFYSVPYLASMAFTCLGLGLWVKAAGIQKEGQREKLKASCAEQPREACAGNEYDKTRRCRQTNNNHQTRRSPVGAESHSARARGKTSHAARARGKTSHSTHTRNNTSLLTIAGSTCLALNLGCRPQFLLASLLGIFIFWEQLTSTKNHLAGKNQPASPKKQLANLACVLLPFVIVAIPLLAYNFVRFGSPFNFGSSYNLTAFNMTNYHQSWHTTAQLLYDCFLQPPQISGEFPFVQVIDEGITAPAGSATWAPNEPMFGGFIWLVPTTLLALALPLCRKHPRSSALVPACITMLCISAALIVIDTRLAGISQRYFADFGLYAGLVSCIVYLGLEELCATGWGVSGNASSATRGSVQQATTAAARRSAAQDTAARARQQAVTATTHAKSQVTTIARNDTPQATTAGFSRHPHTNNVQIALRCVLILALTLSALIGTASLFAPNRYASISASWSQTLPGQ